ncbi:protein phosphatase [Shewanella corallii]|uniref:Protein phosphatase n=1 Tax=Shewanella corallii TaxID=560080 RepID=A0ABT0NA33_9GAMM|nr:protein phosphatase [Shewanella corallii]MCL2915326.1 protein phosphatase [Shewanella corallii]
MKHLFWLVEGDIAGRCGPDTAAWNVTELQDAGFKSVLALSPLSETRKDALNSADIECRFLDMTTSTLLDDAVTPEFCATVAECIGLINQCRELNKPILLCCDTGNELTSLVMACYLTELGAAPVHAVSQVRAMNEQAFSKPGWDQFVFDVIYALQ